MPLEIPDSQTSPAGPTVLIVEDNFLIALSLAEDLKAAGFCIAGPAASVAEAVRVLAQRTVDAVLLDVDLGQELSFPVAACLTLRKIPFAFLTSYPVVEIRRAFPMAVIFGKPADVGAVADGLQALIAQADVRRRPTPSSFPS
jgi:DNA-binding response OmpR family regulator